MLIRPVVFLDNHGGSENKTFILFIHFNPPAVQFSILKLCLPYLTEDYLKINIYYMNRILSFTPTVDAGGRPQISGKSLWQAADPQKNTICTDLTASFVGEQTGDEN
jgi:hypothetical protein